jgi:hypothetical protein
LVDSVSILILDPRAFNPLFPFGTTMSAWRFKVVTIGRDNHAFFSGVSEGRELGLNVKSFLGAFANVLSQVLPLEVIEKKLEELFAQEEKGGAHA